MIDLDEVGNIQGLAESIQSVGLIEVQSLGRVFDGKEPRRNNKQA